MLKLFVNLVPLKVKFLVEKVTQVTYIPTWLLYMNVLVWFMAKKVPLLSYQF